ncbi:HotDog domain-containing protein [Naematelia encephala]|uniref:HotDog domain-containing protein n=1 Tax=Naematelia encephala TaxID=71784 RepID=A0A1Y2AXM4_9TREE|nr:HotDog domain-containing protein [Naematelia encephala]
MLSRARTACTRTALSAWTSRRALSQSKRLMSRNDSEAESESKQLEELFAKFRDPTSHYHLPAGTSGPSHEEDHTTSRLPLGLQLPASSSSFSSTNASSSYSSISGTSASSSSSSTAIVESNNSESRDLAYTYFREEGFDLRGVLEWPVAWGDCDMFRHVNNVQYVRWVEHARIRYSESWDDVLPKETLHGLLSGQGMGYILRDVSVRFKAPVTYPDRVIIANKVHSIDQSRARFMMASTIWSLRQRRVVATAESTMVMFDYDSNCRGTMSDEFRIALESRMPKFDLE